MRKLFLYQTTENKAFSSNEMVWRGLVATGMPGKGALHKNKLHVTAFWGFRHVVVMYENLGFKYN